VAIGVAGRKVHFDAALAVIAAGQEKPLTLHLKPRASPIRVRCLLGAAAAFTRLFQAKSDHVRQVRTHGSSPSMTKGREREVASLKESGFGPRYEMLSGWAVERVVTSRRWVEPTNALAAGGPMVKLPLNSIMAIHLHDLRTWRL
jgi:hypothetical protein